MTDDRPNILYFVCHDLGRHLGAYGAGLRTPNLDRFAAEGALFSRAYCNSPACSPSRGCAMTGQYAHTNGLMGLVNTGWSMPVETRTIVDHLNDAGYETAHFGFQHERWRPEANRYQVEGGVELSDWYVENVVRDAIGFLSERDRSRPFYLNLGTLEVHGTQWQSWTPWGSSRWEVFEPGPPEEAVIPACVPDVSQIRVEMANLQACVEYVDRHVGSLFEALRSLGYEERTLAVFTTDHGLPGMRAKGTLYVHGVEIALLMRMPGTIPAGLEVAHLIQNIDFVPTMLEAAGLEIPPQVQGRSFWPVLTGGEYPPHERIFLERNYHGGRPPQQPVPEGSTEGYDPMRSVRTEKFTYIRNFDPDARREWTPEEVTEFRDGYDTWMVELWPQPAEPRDTEELFDLAADPQERRNVAGDPAYAAVRRSLADELDRWMTQTDDPLLRGSIPDRLNGWPAGA